MSDQVSDAADASPSDPYDLDRFIQAQKDDYGQALSEIHEGRKGSHWMWLIFPQYAGLGFSEMSRKYSIKSLDEARAYLQHPLLGPRLVRCVVAALEVEGKSAREIFGSPDDMKLRSCATLFARVSPAGSLFAKVLKKYFNGEPDPATIKLIRQ